MISKNVPFSNPRCPITEQNLSQLKSDKMKPKRTGRIALTMPLSLQPEDAAFIKEQVARLSPRVSSRSNYIQQLIDLDRQYNLIEKGVVVINEKPSRK